LEEKRYCTNTEVHSEFCSQETNMKYRIVGEYVYSIQDPDMYGKILRAEHEWKYHHMKNLKALLFSSLSLPLNIQALLRFFCFSVSEWKRKTSIYGEMCKGIVQRVQQ
jgi:hypothetical protein